MKRQHGAASTIQFLDEQALLKYLWLRSGLEAFVNGPQPKQHISPLGDADDEAIGRMATDDEMLGSIEWTEFRSFLSNLLPGGSLHPEQQAASGPARLSLVTQTDGTPRWVFGRPSNNFERRQDFYLAVKLLELPALRPLLSRCNNCERFFLRERAHVRDRSFCSPACRVAFHRGRRQPQTHAAYMREYRRKKARQAALRRRAKGGK